MAKKLTRKISTQYHKYLRVWHLLKKPTMEEFKTISKVTVIGLLVIGALGFVVSIIIKNVFQFH
ncbi:protein translocase SEC61 complex subunit gamma [archaeon]|nr:protein translocase SEC61 complex subunit gamma [archaeon]